MRKVDGIQYTVDRGDSLQPRLPSTVYCLPHKEQL